MMGFDSAILTIMDLLFPLVFLFIIGVFIMTIIRGVGTWHKNNNSPRLTVDASVVAKRTSVSHHTHANAGDQTGMSGSIHYNFYIILCNVSSIQRRQNRVFSFRKRIWNSCRKRLW